MDAAGAAAAAALLRAPQGADAPRSDSEGTEPPSDEEAPAHQSAVAVGLVKVQNFPASWLEEDSGLLLQERVSRLLGRFGTLALEPVLAKKEGLPNGSLSSSLGYVFLEGYNEEVCFQHSCITHDTHCISTSQRTSALRGLRGKIICHQGGVQA